MKQAMRSIFANLLPAVFAVFSINQVASCVQVERTDARVTQRAVSSVHIDAVGMANALDSFARQQHVVIGLDMPTVVEGRKVQVDINAGTVSDVLNAIVSTAPGYVWHADSNGYIRVFAIGHPDGLSTLKIRSFSVSGYSRLQFWEALNDIPEIQAWLKEKNCSRRELFGGWEWKKNNDRRIAVDGSGKTLGETLDEAAAQSGIYSWAISQSQLNDKCSVGIVLW